MKDSTIAVARQILNYSSFSIAVPGNLWQIPRDSTRDVDETQKSLIYHVETRNAKIVARIRVRAYGVGLGADLARVCAIVPGRIIGLAITNNARSHRRSVITLVTDRSDGKETVRIRSKCFFKLQKCRQRYWYWSHRFHVSRFLYFFFIREKFFLKYVYFYFNLSIYYFLPLCMNMC